MDNIKNYSLSGFFIFNDLFVFFKELTFKIISPDIIDPTIKLLSIGLLIGQLVYLRNRNKKIKKDETK